MNTCDLKPLDTFCQVQLSGGRLSTASPALDIGPVTPRRLLFSSLTPYPRAPKKGGPVSAAGCDITRSHILQAPQLVSSPKGSAGEGSSHTKPPTQFALCRKRGGVNYPRVHLLRTQFSVKGRGRIPERVATAIE